MFDLFNTLLGSASSISDADLQKFLQNCTIKVNENGKQVVDIENGIDKLKKRESTKPVDNKNTDFNLALTKGISARTRAFDNGTDFLIRTNDGNWKKLSLDPHNPGGISKTSLLDILYHII